MSSRKVCFPFLILKNFDCFAFENTFDNIKPQILITCSTRAKKKMWVTYLDLEKTKREVVRMSILSILKQSRLFCHCKWPTGMKLRPSSGRKESVITIGVTGKQDRWEEKPTEMARLSGIQMRLECFLLGSLKTICQSTWNTEWSSLRR